MNILSTLTSATDDDSLFYFSCLPLPGGHHPKIPLKREESYSRNLKFLFANTVFGRNFIHGVVGIGVFESIEPARET